MGAVPEPRKIAHQNVQPHKATREASKEKRNTNLQRSLRGHPHWRFALGSVCSVFRVLVQDASEQPSPGRERIRLRAQRARQLPVDPNPYLRLWAHFITLAVCYLLSGSSPALCFDSVSQ